MYHDCNILMVPYPNSGVRLAPDEVGVRRTYQNSTFCSTF